MEKEEPKKSDINDIATEANNEFVLLLVQYLEYLEFEVSLFESSPFKVFISTVEKGRNAYI